MSVIDTGFLILVVGCFAVFAIVLAVTSWRSP